MTKSKRQESTRLAQSTEPAPKSDLVSFKIWEVVAPPPITSLKGALVPRVFVSRRRRKVSIEVHRIASAGHQGGSYEECIVRVLNPNQKVREEQNKKRRNKKDEELLDQDIADDESTVAHPEMMDANTRNFAAPDGLDGWEEKYRFPIRYITVKGTNRTGIFVQITLGRMKQTRQLIFDSMAEAEEFRNVLEKEIRNEKDRNDAKLNVVFHGKSPPEADDITFLVEIVSGWDLPVGDLSTSDPYVIASFDGNDVHKTQVIEKTLDPIWTVKTGSLFLFRSKAEALYLSEGLLFTVKDYDALGRDEKLGMFYVAPKVVYEAKGERLEFKLIPTPGSKKKEVPGYVAIRIRRATGHDIVFMNEHVHKKKKTSLAESATQQLATAQLGGGGALRSYFRRQTRHIKDGDRDIKQYKVRPGPDPKREEETTWLSKEQIEAECQRESDHWLDVGNGRLGRLHVEILGCDELPNLDSGGRNKTDTFVALVYEDCVVKTDVVDDCLNPRWLPWSKRAAIFHIHHSSSQLFLGVFDFDQSVAPGDDHDLIGRVAVDLTNLRKDTMYVMVYDLYTTARISDRKKLGSITIRLRLEVEDDRAVLLSNLEPPPSFYVNVKTRKDHRVVQFTCSGKYDTSKYDIKFINSYIEEILSVQHASFYLSDAFMRLMLWRGTMPVRMLGTTYHFPIHSLAAFVSLAVVVERPELFPAWSFALFGWTMVATMDYRLHLPTPWLHCKHFLEHAFTLFYGSTPIAPYSIESHENAKEAIAFEEGWRKRITESEEAAAKEYEENLKAQEEYQREMDEIGDVSDISALNKNDGGISVDPFKSVLYPVQQNLQMVCKYLRRIRYVLIWEESYISFWVTAGCFLVSIIFLFVPWFFLIQWTARILVWALFGPWMKLVDIFYVSKLDDYTEEELMQQRLESRKKRRLATATALAEARIKREDAMKLKAMKAYYFGKYITRVPVLKEDRYVDTPCLESHALPFKPDPLPLSELAMQEAGYHRTRIPGQHLVGSMIPQIETVSFTEAPVGQALRRPNLVDKDIAGPESTTAAYAKIGSLVVCASVISWFAVPFFSSLTQHLLVALQEQTE
eukprot:CAMPEP_0168738488 /NCGR_PEP_ID=MMETSP0724-20121128/10959_1 /TAXON_ID=265536 /ORGANISM="Amphiprora sp., Strain CCMP467" /LENGTH=1081 /DNA_ID=CAMNT_0008785833 /DNA_START=7 /DNA_END=3252 /DNA_ORIENTATION=+